jgi:hypothetical protein
MSRYIDAEQIPLITTRGVDESGDIFVSLMDVWKALNKTPTADVEEVRHGVWIEQIYDYGEYLITEGFACSVCGLELMDNDYNYCPNCGARMDGERREK